MMKKATALLVLLALCGLLPAAAQEPQEEMTTKAKTMAGDAMEKADDAEKMVEDAKGMVEGAEGMVEDAEGMVEDAEAMVDKAEKMMESDATLEEVLDAHYEALGGSDAWQAVGAVRYTGNMQMGPGMEAPFTMTLQRPKNIRLDFVFQGMTGTQASNGDSTWMVMPFMGKKDPEAMPEEMGKQFQDQADIEGPLFDWQAKEHEVELVGLMDMEGTEVYKVKMTRKGGDVLYHFLESEYYVAVKQESKRDVQGQEMEIETAIGDYKEVCATTSMLVDDDNPCDGDALMIPHSFESKTKGAVNPMQVITIEKVEVNPEGVEASFFSMPTPEEAPAEEAEAGE